MSVVAIALSTAGAYPVWLDWERQKTLEAIRKREAGALELSAAAQAKVAGAMAALDRRRNAASRRLADEAIREGRRAVSLAPGNGQATAALASARAAARTVDTAKANAVGRLIGDAKAAARRDDFALAASKLHRVRALSPAATRLERARDWLIAARVDHRRQRDAARRRKAGLIRQPPAPTFATGFLSDCRASGRRTEARCRCLARRMADAFEQRQQLLLAAFFRGGRDPDRLRDIMRRFGRDETIATVLRMRVLAARMSRACPVGALR